MPRPRISKSLPQHGRVKPRRRNSPKHLAWIRTLECPIYPGLRPIQAHHLMRVYDDAGKRIILSASERSDDRWAIPLCRKAHDELHQRGDEDAYLSSHGTDGRALAARLWAVSGDSEAGLRAVYRAKAVARVEP